MNRSLLRSALFVPFLVAGAACGGSGGEEAAPVIDQGHGGDSDAGASSAAPRKDGGSSSAARGPDGGPPGTKPTKPLSTVDVHGTVTSYAGVPVVGRTTRVLDANGKRTDVVTDAAGGFAASGVVTPYDVSVAPEGLTDDATVYLGIEDAAPHLRGELASAQVTWVKQTFNVGAFVTGCIGGCEVAFVTKSPHGSGAASTSVPAGSIAASVSLDHQFVSDGSPSEPVTLHVLAHDAAGSWFGYAEASLTAVAGQTSPGGVHSLDPVGVHPLAMDLQGAAAPASWRPGLSISITFADGAGAAVYQGSGASVTTYVPEIPGATLAAFSSLVDPITDTNRTIHNTVYSWSGNLPFAAPSVTLSAAAPLHDVVPAPGSTISLKGPGISWTAAPSTLTFIGIGDVTHSRALASIYTDGSSVTWEKLERLGVAVSPGDLALSLTGVASSDLASLVAGTATASGALIDWSAPGSVSDESWRFSLTP